MPITDETPTVNGATSVFPNKAKVITVPATQVLNLVVNGVNDPDLGVVASAGKTGYYQVQYYEE